MTVQELAKAIKKCLRKRTPKTASDLAYEVKGIADGRTISRALSVLVEAGDIAVHGGRPIAYVKP